ncbi:MAG: hypothetical protein QGH45_10620, partial [Myxococcota bacterium]|nr:hypothetical protein [Myxococcota bacterium]
NETEAAHPNNRILLVAITLCALLILCVLVLLAVGQIRSWNRLAALEEIPTVGLPNAGLPPTGEMGLPVGEMVPPGGADPVAGDGAALPTGVEVPEEYRSLVGEDLPDVMYRVGDVEIIAAIVRMEGTARALDDASLTTALELYEKQLEQRFVPGQADARLGLEASLLELLDDDQKQFLYKNLTDLKSAVVQPEVILAELRTAVAGRG